MYYGFSEDVLLRTSTAHNDSNMTEAPIMKWIFKVFVSYTLLPSALAFANASIADSPWTKGRWYLAGQLGGQGAKANSSTTVHNGSGFPAPFDRDIYTSANRNMAVLLGLEAGQRWDVHYPWLSAFSLGLRYQYFMNTDMHGQVMQFSLPQFTNYNYKWQSAANVLLANAKLNFKQYQLFSPYVNAGLGSALYSGGKYSETALEGVTARISPHFANRSGGQFAYQLGAGVDYQFSEAILLNAGYQYSNLAAMRSGPGTDNWSSQSLNFGTVHSNAFLLGMTYVFDAKAPFDK